MIMSCEGQIGLKQKVGENGEKKYMEANGGGKDKG